MHTGFSSFAFITIFGCVYAVPVPQDAQASNTTMVAAAAASTAAQTADASSPINGLLAGLGMVPIIGESITAVSTVLTDFESVLAKTLNVDTTESAASGCTKMTVIFARGTTEPGNVGLVTGPPFFDALSAMIGANSISVQGVEYPASIEGFLQGGDATGSQTM
jgi:Cutinase